MAWRAIGELCRDVIARCGDEAMQRGSFEPREFAEEPHRSIAIGSVGLGLSGVVPQVVALPIDVDASAKRPHFSTASIFEDALFQGAVALLIGSVLRAGCQPQVAYAVVMLHTICMVDLAFWLLAIDEIPSDAMLQVIGTVEADLAVSVSVDASSPAADVVVQPVGGLPSELPAFRVV